MNDFKYVLINTSFRISNVMLFIPLFILTTLLFGQDAKILYLFEFEDESEYAGELISETPDIVIIKRMDGSVINIPAYKIIKRTRINISQSDSTLAYWDEESDEIIFSNYFFFIPAFGIAGLAIATLVSQCIGLIYLANKVYCCKLKRYLYPECFKPKFEILSKNNLWVNYWKIY